MIRKLFPYTKGYRHLIILGVLCSAGEAVLELMLPLAMSDIVNFGIELGDDVEVTTNIGSITFKAIPTATVQKGEVFIYHGYKDFDINSILDGTNLDPYSGFPAYRSAFCNIRRK